MDSVLKELQKNIIDLKTNLYKDIIIYDTEHRPSDLTPLNHYMTYLIKILQYWYDITYMGPSAATKLMMPTHELQELFHEKTVWYIKNIINNPDSNIRTDALYLLKKNYEKTPLYLS